MRKKKSIVAEIPKMRTAPSVTPPLNGVRLSPFSGDNTACIKCGNKGASTSWFSAGRTCIHLGTGFRVVWGVERLHRVCSRCHFAWDEACVPAIPQQVGETMLMPVVSG